MLCLLTDLQLICGALQPEARRVVPPAPCSPHALPCLHQPAVPARGRHGRQIEVACQSQTETRIYQKFPEKASGYFKAFFTGPAKKAQWRFQLDICCGRCSSELVLWAPDPLSFGLTASCVGPRVVGAAVCRPWEVMLTCLPFDALEWQGATGYFSPGLTFLLLRLPGS